MNNIQYKITSDGSRTSNGTAACACIVEQAENDSWIRVAKLCALLGLTTVPEAELAGGILGLAFCKNLERNSSDIKISTIQWYGDCTTVLSSAESGGRDGPFWDCFLKVKGETLVETTYVHIKSNRKLKACDAASRWISESGEKLLQRFGEGAIGKMSDVNPKLAWQLRDARDIDKLC